MKSLYIRVTIIIYYPEKTHSVYHHFVALYQRTAVEITRYQLLFGGFHDLFDLVWPDSLAEESRIEGKVLPEEEWGP